MIKQTYKAVILAAGKGTRLSKVVRDIPKPMIQINQNPILEHNILSLKRCHVSEVYINLHFLPEVIKGYLGTGEKWNIKITYVFEPELLGTAGALNNFRPFIMNSPFLLVYGDNLIDFDLDSLIQYHNEKAGIATLGLYYRDKVCLSGVVDLDENGRVTKFIEKPELGKVCSHLVNTGVYMLDPRILKYIPTHGFSDFGKDIFPALIEQGEEIYGLLVKGRVIPVDTPELLKIAKGGEKR